MQKKKVITGWCHSIEQKTAKDGPEKSFKLALMDQFDCRKFEGNQPNQERHESTNRNP